MALVLPALTDCRWWFESLLVRSGVSSATRRKATGADQKKREKAQLPTMVDPKLLEGTTVNFSRSLVRLAWMLQHAVTLLSMAGEIQAVLNSQTAGVSDMHGGLCYPPVHE